MHEFGEELDHDYVNDPQDETIDRQAVDEAVLRDDDVNDDLFAAEENRREISSNDEEIKPTQQNKTEN